MGIVAETRKFELSLVAKLPSALLVASLGVTILGCVSSGNPNVRDETLTSQIQVNVSTKEDVRRILGQPNSTSRQPGSLVMIPGQPASPGTVVESWNYTHIDVEVDGATFIPIVGLFAGGATSSVSSFTVTFDDKGVVRHISSTQSTGQSGMGSGQKKRMFPPMSVST